MYFSAENCKSHCHGGVRVANAALVDFGSNIFRFWHYSFSIENSFEKSLQNRGFSALTSRSGFGAANRYNLVEPVCVVLLSCAPPCLQIAMEWLRQGSLVVAAACVILLCFAAILLCLGIVHDFGFSIHGFKCLKVSLSKSLRCVKTSQCKNLLCKSFSVTELALCQCFAVQGLLCVRDCFVQTFAVCKSLLCVKASPCKG